MKEYENAIENLQDKYENEEELKYKRRIIKIEERIDELDEQNRKAKKYATMLVDFIIDKQIFQEFYITDEEDPQNFLKNFPWLPKKILDSVLSHPYDARILFNVKKGYYSISLNYIATKEPEKESKNIKIELSKNEIIRYLSDFFYYNPLIVMFELNGNNSFNYIDGVARNDVDKLFHIPK